MIIVLQAFFFMVTILAALASQAEKRVSAVEDRTILIAIRPAVNLEMPAANGVVDVSNELTLAEIVDSMTIPAAERELVIRQLQSITLSDRPNVGEERTFTRDGLESVVGEGTRRLETAGFVVEWKIPMRSRVSRRLDFSREKATKLLLDEFSNRCGGCEVDIKKIDWPQIELLKIATWRFAFRSERPRGSFAVPLEIELASADQANQNTIKKTFMLTGQVEFFAAVPVTTRVVQTGEKFSATDFKIERRNVTFILDAAASPADFETGVAAKGFSMGEAIWKSSLRRELHVRFGDPVRVQVGGETWSVTSDGIAQGSAAVGDTVRVKVGKSQKLISGVLKEKGLVEIQ